MTIILSSGWENSGGADITDGGIWTSAGSIALTNSCRSGRFAVAASTTRALVYTFPSPKLSDGFVQIAFKRGSTPSGNTNFIEIYDSGYVSGVILYLDTSNVLQITCPSGTYSSGVTIALNAWYILEIERVVGAGNGIVRLWVNGELMVEKTAETISGNLNEVDTGLTSYSGAFDVVIDDVHVSDAYIGLISATKLWISF